ncbi:MAG: hypothetical protein KDD55_04080 [Bdellovibrionales bacterium]|nr:hypothetical protein [Bdellovibrionales bacterium]
MSDSPIVLYKRADGASELESALKEWGYIPVSFTSMQEALKLLTKEDSSGLILLEWRDNDEDLPAFLASLRQAQHETPSYTLLLGKAEQHDTLLEAMHLGAQDIFVYPIDYQLLKSKLHIGLSTITDKQALIDASQVLERYAMHIDRIAAERARQLFHAERLSTLGTMSAGLAHEISTPIGYISASLQTVKILWEQIEQILSNLDNTQQESEKIEKLLEKYPKALGRIELGMQKIDKLMSGLKNFARSSRGDRVPTNINDCVHMALEMAESTLKYHVHVEHNLQENLPLIEVDAQQIEQVCINLFVNAAHAMEETQNATLHISTHADEESHVTLVIEDNGPGIPEEALESIWQPYYTTKEVGKGTGLGLAICRNLIRDNSGTIQVSKGDKGGARFEIVLH